MRRVALGIVAVVLLIGVGVTVRSRRAPANKFSTLGATAGGAAEADRSGPTPEAAIRAIARADHLKTGGRCVIVDPTRLTSYDLDDGRSFDVEWTGDRYRVTLYGTPCQSRADQMLGKATNAVPFTNLHPPPQPTTSTSRTG